MSVCRDLMLQTALFSTGALLAVGGSASSFTRLAVLGMGVVLILIVSLIKLLLESDRAHWIRSWWIINFVFLSMVVAAWVHATWIHIPGRQGVIVEEWSGRVSVYENPRLIVGRNVAEHYPWPWCVRQYRHYPLGSVEVNAAGHELIVSVDRARLEQLLSYETDLDGRKALKRYAEQVIAAEGETALTVILEALKARGLAANSR